MVVTVVKPVSKKLIGTISNNDYLQLSGKEKMPPGYYKQRKAAEEGHANPLFDMGASDPRYWFASFGKKGKSHPTHFAREDETGGYSIFPKEESSITHE